MKATERKGAIVSIEPMIRDLRAVQEGALEGSGQFLTLCKGSNLEGFRANGRNGVIISGETLVVDFGAVLIVNVKHYTFKDCDCSLA